MKKTVFFLIPILVAVFGIAVSGQGTEKKDLEVKKAEAAAANATVAACPRFELRGVGGRIVREGEQIPISVNVNGGDTTVAPTFVWSTSAGIIANGQGTRSISIDSTGAAFERQITASLWVSGYPAECPSQFSETVKIAGPARKVDEFAELDTEKESWHIKDLTDSLYGISDNTFVIAYAGRNSPRGYATAALKRIKAQIVANGVTPDRIGIIDGGFREEPGFELWVVPVGADMPKATPTIKAKDIIYPKTTPAKKP